jgi:hypothetical protein
MELEDFCGKTEFNSNRTYECINHNLKLVAEQKLIDETYRPQKKLRPYSPIEIIKFSDLIGIRKPKK